MSSENGKALASFPHRGSQVMYRSLGLVATLIVFCVKANAAVLSEVAVSPAFFNPALGQTERIQYTVEKAGTVTLAILDRDKYPVRTRSSAVTPGRITTSWDGRDDDGSVVPDEAYTVRLIWRAGVETETYDPAAGFHPEPKNPVVNSYSASAGVLSYTLAEPSRVHAQAGQSLIDEVSKKRTDILLKTLIDDAPRSAGQVIQTWDGLADGAPISVPDLPGFVVAILATPLPKNSIITVGNRSTTFFDYAVRRRPAAATRPRDLRWWHGHHHEGLTALEDQSPSVEVELVPADPKRNPAEIHLRISLSGPRAPYFLSQPTELTVYADSKVVTHLEQPSSPSSVRIPVRQLSSATRIVANWTSRLGPAAAGSVALPPKAAAEEHR